MRLIDADELIKDRVENDPVRIAVSCAPTAYDVDKVIDQLEQNIRAITDQDGVSHFVIPAFTTTYIVEKAVGKKWKE